MLTDRLRRTAAAVLTMVLAVTLSSQVVLPAQQASAQAPPQAFYAMVDLDGRGSLHVEDRVAVDAYLSGDPIDILCQQAGPSYGGSSIWDYTRDGYWVPDAYVYTGYSGYHPTVSRCMDTGHATDIPRPEPAATGPFSAMVALDGRTRPVISDPDRTVDAYLGGDTIHLMCQDNGPSYGGSSIWDYTTDGYWVPDAYVYTGYSGFHPSTPRCSTRGLRYPGTSTHGPYHAKVALDGRDGLSADAHRTPDVYLAGDPIEIVCQERGPYYAGSDLWDYTSLGYWVPDVYVYTGSMTFIPGIPRCAESTITSGAISGQFRGGFGPYPAKYDLNGRHSPRADDWGPGDVDVYLAGDLLRILCQDYGEQVAGSTVWIFTTDGYWIPDAYVRTGTSSFLSFVPRCRDVAVAGYDAPAGGHGPYPAKVALDGRSSINPEVVAVVDLYQAGQLIYLKCQGLGVQKYGSSIWGYTTDGYWVPDHYIKTGTDGFAAGVPRCSDIGIEGGDGAPTVLNVYAGDRREGIVAAARSQIGVVEGANNCNPYGFCAAWCTMFATWTWSQVGIDVGGSRVMGNAPWYFSGSLYQWALSNDRVRSFGDARPGDIVIYGDSPGRTHHTGVVEYVYLDGDIATIEGNLSNMVRRVSRFDPNLSHVHHPSSYSILAIIAPVNDELTPPEDKPGAVSSTAQGANSVTLTWEESSDASNYFIERWNIGAPGGYIRMSTAVDGTSHTVTGLFTGSWYRFRVIPANGTRTGPASRAYEVRTKGDSNYTTYYALGDSYSAGDGSGTASAPYVGECKRTNNAWSYQISPSYAPDPNHLACSGAQLPGLRDQLEDVWETSWARTLITITVGGNDLDWTSELANCIYGVGDCTNRESAVEQRIDNLEDDLREFYEDVRLRAPGADIVVVGYPRLAPRPEDDAWCPWFNKAESDMIYRLGGYLNDTIRSAAAAAGVTSAISQLDAEFAGHEPCSSGDDYVHGLVGECCPLPPLSGDSYHPKLSGQQAYGRAVETRLDGLFATGAKRPALPLYQ